MFCIHIHMLLCCLYQPLVLHGYSLSILVCINSVMINISRALCVYIQYMPIRHIFTNLLHYIDKVMCLHIHRTKYDVWMGMFVCLFGFFFFAHSKCVSLRSSEMVQRCVVLWLQFFLK